MDFEKLESVISLLARYWFSLSPSSPNQIPITSFPSSRDLSQSIVQAQLVQHLFSAAEDARMNQTEQEELESAVSASWRKVFLKKVIKMIEAGMREREEDGEDITEEEIHPEILDQLIRYLSVPPTSSTQLIRRYIWGPLDQSTDYQVKNSVSTIEDGRMISSGTTGLRTWQASIALANHFISNPKLSSSAVKILELGAGVGLTSLVAAKLLPSFTRTRIIATDVDERVLEQLEENVKINNREDIISVETLDWDLSGSAEGRVEIENRFGATDLIIGADIVYDPTLAQSLSRLLKVLLQPSSKDSTTSPVALIAATIRNQSTWNSFLLACSTNKLVVDEIELNSPGDAGIVGVEGWEGEGRVILVRITAA